MTIPCPVCGKPATAWRDYREREGKVDVHYVHEDQSEHIKLKDIIDVNPYTRD